MLSFTQNISLERVWRVVNVFNPFCRSEETLRKICVYTIALSVIVVSIILRLSNVFVNNCGYKIGGLEGIVLLRVTPSNKT